MNPEQEARFLEELLGAKRFYDGFQWETIKLVQDDANRAYSKIIRMNYGKSHFAEYLASNNALHEAMEAPTLWFDDPVWMGEPEPLTRDERLLLLCK